MKLYHGTLYENSTSIISDGIIRVTDKMNTQYGLNGFTKTTYDYVYLSTSLNEALGFALLAAMNKRNDFNVAVFEVEVPDCDVEPDLDEKKHMAIVTQVDLSETSTVRVNRDINLKDSNSRVWLVEFESYSKGCMLADNPNINEEKIVKWEKI